MTAFNCSWNPFYFQTRESSSDSSLQGLLNDWKLQLHWVIEVDHENYLLIPEVFNYWFTLQRLSQARSPAVPHGRKSITTVSSKITILITTWTAPAALPSATTAYIRFATFSTAHLRLDAGHTVGEDVWNWYFLNFKVMQLERTVIIMSTSITFLEDKTTYEVWPAAGHIEYKIDLPFRWKYVNLALLYAMEKFWRSVKCKLKSAGASRRLCIPSAGAWIEGVQAYNCRQTVRWSASLFSLQISYIVRFDYKIEIYSPPDGWNVGSMFVCSNRYLNADLL